MRAPLRPASCRRAGSVRDPLRWRLPWLAVPARSCTTRPTQSKLLCSAKRSWPTPSPPKRPADRSPATSASESRPAHRHLGADRSRATGGERRQRALRGVADSRFDAIDLLVVPQVERRNLRRVLGVRGEHWRLGAETPATPNYAGKYAIPRRWPVVRTLPPAMSFFIGSRIVVTSVPSCAAICSPRWPGCCST